MGKRIACFAFAVFILQTCTFCFGQTTSRVTGVVRDSSGAVISGAQVALTNDETGVSFTTTTTSAGTYVFDAVNPGVYSVKVSAKGFKSLSSSGNVVTIGQPATVNATLAPGAVNESIVVSGTVEQVQTSTSGNIGNLVDNAALLIPAI